MTDNSASESIPLVLTSVEATTVKQPKTEPFIYAYDQSFVPLSFENNIIHMNCIPVKDGWYHRLVSNELEEPIAAVVVSEGPGWGWSTIYQHRLWGNDLSPGITQKDMKHRMMYDSELIRFLVDKDYQRMMLERFLPGEEIYPMDVRKWVEPIRVPVSINMESLDRQNDRLWKLLPLITHLLGWKTVEQSSTLCGPRLPGCMYGFYQLEVDVVPRGKPFRITRVNCELDGFEAVELLDLNTYTTA